MDADCCERVRNEQLCSELSPSRCDVEWRFFERVGSIGWLSSCAWIVQRIGLIEWVVERFVRILR
jgi:hypothetical protein